jgi:hypothetical protein
VPENYYNNGWPYSDQHAAEAAAALGLGAFLTFSEFDLPDFRPGLNRPYSGGSNLDYEWDYVLAS